MELKEEHNMLNDDKIRRIVIGDISYELFDITDRMVFKIENRTYVIGDQKEEARVVPGSIRFGVGEEVAIIDSYQIILDKIVSEDIKKTFENGIN